MRSSVSFGSERPKIKFYRAVINLIGHLAGTGVLFLSFYLIGWCISYVIHWLDAIHKLSPEISALIIELELYLAYADAVLCAIVLLAGAWRFVRDLGDLA